MPEVVRRAVGSSLGMLLASEEGIRKLATEFSLPKDVANYLVSQAQGSRDEIWRVLANELRRILENFNLDEEIQRLLRSFRLEIKSEIRFVPNEDKPGSVTDEGGKTKATAESSDGQ